MPKLPVQNDSIPDTSAQSQHAEGINAQVLSETQCILCKNRRICIALKNDRPLQTLFHFGQERESVPTRKVRRVMKTTGGKFERPGRSNTNSDEVATFLMLFNQLDNRVAHVVDNSQGASFKTSAQ